MNAYVERTLPGHCAVAYHRRAELGRRAWVVAVQTASASAWTIREFMSQSFGMSTAISADHTIIPFIEKQFPPLSGAVNLLTNAVAIYREIRQAARSTLRRVRDLTQCRNVACVEDTTVGSTAAGHPNFQGDRKQLQHRREDV